MHDLQALARRYLALWHASDATARGAQVAALFTEDAIYYSAAGGVASGRDAVTAGIEAVHRAWVLPGRYTFRSAGNADGHHDAVRFNWELISVAQGSVVGVGFEFLLLAEDGRIRQAYRFIDSSPALLEELPDDF